jgi:hypothetical protein
MAGLEGVFLCLGNPLLDVSAVVDQAFLDKYEVRPAAQEGHELRAGQDDWPARGAVAPDADHQKPFPPAPADQAGQPDSRGGEAPSHVRGERRELAAARAARSQWVVAQPPPLPRRPAASQARFHSCNPRIKRKLA